MHSYISYLGAQISDSISFLPCIYIRIYTYVHLPKYLNMRAKPASRAIARGLYIYIARGAAQAARSRLNAHAQSRADIENGAAK